jgi:hypothetical protein
MKVIYAFKQFKTEHYKPFDDTFFKLAKLSVGLAKKYYRTELYCDSESKILFEANGVYFDKVVVSDKIENYTGSLTSMAKIYAMMEQDESYIIADFDTLILQQLPQIHSIGFGYPELVNMHINTLLEQTRPDAYIDYIEKYYKGPYELHKDKFPSWFKVDPHTSPNNCLVMVRHPFLVKAIYDDILSKFTDEETDKTGPMFIEQFLLYHYLKNHALDVGYLENSYINPTEINYSLVSHRFLHFMDYHVDKLIHDKIEYISKMYNITL